MLLAVQFFSINDFFLVPLCLLLMYGIVRSRVNACNDINVRKYYYKAFYFKIAFVFAYAIVTEFYFGGGDTALYYQAVKDLRAALSDNLDYLKNILGTSKLNDTNALSPYFIYDNSTGAVTYAYMKTVNNFFIPRLGLIPSLLFANSYLCICLCFAMFALGGAIRLFKVFYYYYPSAKKEIALAILFLPSVNFWSAGFLKDPLCFGALGFILYGILNVFIKKTKIIASVIWIIIGSYLLIMIKGYIFLVLLLAIAIWLFSEINTLIKDTTLRRIFAVMTFAISIGVGYFLLQYFTSADTLQQYQLDNLVSSADHQRNNYQRINEYSPDEQSSFYTINASNPFLLVVNSLVATFFRPFPWEIGSAAAVLSAIEALAFIFITVNLLIRKGILNPLRVVFNDPLLLMSFVFALVFAIGVGASTANFGTLSRYKIPCMPFYLLTMFLVYRKMKLPYPKWLNTILGYKK